jgi:hypothetical protein
MSSAGVVSAAAGSLVAEGFVNVFTKEENKPASKGVILKLATSFKPYHKIKNLPVNHKGKRPTLICIQGM